MHDKRSTALSTGASSGIGRALSRRFADAEYDLILVCEREAELQDAESELRNAYPSLAIDGIAADLTQETALQNLCAQLRRIRIDVLVNDAGAGPRGEFIEIPLERHLDVIKLNVVALTTLTRIIGGDMARRGGGKILNFGSVAGFEAGPLLALYQATKAFVVCLSEALAGELKERNVSVTCLCPGAAPAEEVAAAGFDGLMAGELMVIPGVQNSVITGCAEFHPPARRHG